MIASVYAMAIPMNIETISCFLSLIVLIMIGLYQIYNNRKKIIYFLKHRSLPEKQMRACPGCGSTILMPLGPDNVKCNDCGAIFAATRSIVKSSDGDK